jgi:HlyD family secretion protein
MTGTVSKGQVGGQQAGEAMAVEAAGARRRAWRRWAAGGATLIIVAAAVALALTDPFRARASAGAGGTAYHTGTATVTLRSLTSQTQVNATLGDSGSYSVVNPAQGSPAGSPAGTITWLPKVGSVVRQGQELYAVTGSPVVLLYGNVPAYRDLAEGVTGPDVTELNTGLVRLGYATAAALGPRPGWDYFSGETAYAVELLQAHLGETQTGTLALGQAVFLPGAALVTGYGSNVVLGGAVTAGQVVLTASSTTPVVTIALDAAQQTEVRKGEPVSITLPDGATTPGTVSSVSNIASSSSSSSGSSSSSDSGGSGPGTPATITVQVSLSNPKAAGSLNQAPVQVTITTGRVSNALVVPVNALLAQSSGGYAVEVAGADGRHHLVAVTPGLFDDAAGLVQVTGTGLAAGQRVVVPAT